MFVKVPSDEHPVPASLSSKHVDRVMVLPLLVNTTFPTIAFPAGAEATIA